jgi:hypothetical protein
MGGCHSMMPVSINYPATPEALNLLVTKYPESIKATNNKGETLNFFLKDRLRQKERHGGITLYRACFRNFSAKR